MVGVIGWLSAIARSAAGIVSVGTKALLRYGRKSTKNVKPLAASALLASRPRQTDSQEIASTQTRSTPAVAIHSTGPAVGRNPVRYATPTTRTVANALRTTLATTCPVSTAELRIGSDRKRSIIPSVMSEATSTAVVDAPKPVQSRMIPGTT